MAEITSNGRGVQVVLRLTPEEADVLEALLDAGTTGTEAGIMQKLAYASVEPLESVPSDGA